MQPDERLERVRVLRERGQTPKQIARAPGVRPAEAGRLVRAAAILARAEAPEPAVAGCWISPGWSAGLIIGDHSGWPLGELSGFRREFYRCLSARRRRRTRGLW